ncbi:MAG: hypothetical protein JNK30_18360 [Phenylobacterium sp.]|uniref:phage/plasmid primase, P4 family n=1 Tax=Phenylobacterium sp. TaxID=1871053 RepID=UPI001A57B543|nr:phage/plasmid primase, P4 family [Phenylobacterium sp.]MBL8773353.1 hypothetical protein [Phenylobacterium sp.]
MNVISTFQAAGDGPFAVDEGVEAPAYSDEDLALRVAGERAGDARYVAAWGRWYRLVGHKWAADVKLATLYAVRETCRQAACGSSNPKEALALASYRTVSAVERLARCDPRLAATVDQWDADPLLLNTPGGVVDLNQWTERPAVPEDYFTKSTAVAPAASGVKPERWRSFLDEVTGGDAMLARHLQKIAGYCLSGDTSHHAIFFAYGTGANGKSVFVNTLMGVLGDYATSTPMETLMASKEDRHPTELADLRGARLVTSVETEEGRRWAESRVKQLTGGDAIKARFMRQDFFEFRPQFKLLVAGNHKPALRGVDEAIRRRFQLLPFTVTIPPQERDPDLAEKLRSEWPAILRWMIEGYDAFREEGLAPPPAVAAATAEYLEAEDAFGQWVEDCCERHGDAFEPTGTLYASWKSWATRHGEYVGPTKRFVQTLTSHGFEYRRTNAARGFRGLRVRALSVSDAE